MECCRYRYCRDQPDREKPEIPKLMQMNVVLYVFTTRNSLNFLSKSTHLGEVWIMTMSARIADELTWRNNSTPHLFNPLAKIWISLYGVLSCRTAPHTTLVIEERCMYTIDRSASISSEVSYFIADQRSVVCHWWIAVFDPDAYLVLGVQPMRFVVSLI